MEILTQRYVCSEWKEGVSSVMRISKRAAVTGQRQGIAAATTQSANVQGEEVAVRRRYDGTPAGTGEY